ncbi:MAG: hypothetical protein ABI416_17195 [Ginsengibacter sp.]
MTVSKSTSATWYVKYFDAFFITIAVGYMFQSLVTFLPDKIAALYPSFLRVSYKYLLLPSVAGALYLVITGKLEREGKFNSEKAHAIFFGLIRFWLAAGIASYGFAKVLKTQFSGANDVAFRDSLIGDLSGNYLTWFYFNFSSTFILIVGYIQIGGALLLLFRRTNLLGTFILLPVMANIVMINIFYGIPMPPTIISIVFTAALIYLLLLHARELTKLFFKTVYALPKPGSSTFTNILRISVVAYAFLSIYQYVLKNKYIDKTGDPEILGKWKVEQSSMNGQEISSNAWQTDSTAWATIYFLNAGFCAIGSNPYYYERTQRNIGEYSFDKSKLSLNIYFFKTKDSLHAIIDSPEPGKMSLRGMLGKDSISMRLSKVKM